MLSDYLTLITVFKFDIPWPTLLPKTWVAVSLLLGFCILMFIELHAPREKLTKKNLKQSYLTNMGLFLFNNVLLSVLPISSVFLVAKYYADNGLLRGVSNPALKVFLSLLALDCVLYAWHRACHRFDCLWMFHKVHHSDPTLNLSTAFRLHFLEVALTNLFKTLCIVVFGIDEIIVLISEAITTLCIMFHHTNITFRGEQWLGKIMIVPSLHRTHHSVLRSEHDSNYGAVLSVWDSLFGSRLEANPAAIGINEYTPQGVMGLIWSGLTLTPAAAPIKPAVLEHMIAEAAYYKAEKRGFNPGHDIHDWLEAKKEIITAVYGARRANRLISTMQIFKQM
jgi:sterol desaturase/sphingolipid hydroxylase (fatty acid hydroxylase superfamily)